MIAKRIQDIMMRHPVATIILFGLFSRIICMLLYRHITIYPDSEGYIYLGRLLADGNLAGYTGERSPGYPLLLAAAGNLLSVAVAFQAVLGLVTAVYLYKTLLRLHFKAKAALVITLLLNSLLHVIFYETAILTESFTLFFMTLIFYMLFSSFFTPVRNIKKIVLLGFLLGCLTLIKPFYVFLPFVIYGLDVLRNFSLKRIINTGLLIVVFPLASFLGWSYVNKVNTGYFVSTTFYGINMAQNCVWFAEKAPEEYKQISTIYVKHREQAVKQKKDVAMTIWFAYDDLKDATGLGFPDLSQKLAGFSKAAIQDNPADYAQQVFVSWMDFWKVDMYWNYDDFSTKYANKVLLAAWLVQWSLLLAIKAIFVLLLPFVAIKAIRNRRVTPGVVIGAVVLATSLLQAIVTYGTNSRFSYPFEFLMVIAVLLFCKGSGKLKWIGL
jgi:4-amino-4-deoxy-L-arabinose transferase-like glycosyltransferase